MFKVFFLILISLSFVHASKCKEALENEVNKVTFASLLENYRKANDVAADFFKSKEQVWFGECVSIYSWKNTKDYYRHENYLVIFRPSTITGELSKVQYGAVSYGGNPYSNGIPINTAALAIEWLKGDAGQRISHAENANYAKSLRAKYYEEGHHTNLRHGMWKGQSTLFYTLEDKDRNIEEVCYFNAILVK